MRDEVLFASASPERAARPVTEHVETALSIVAGGSGDTIVSRAVTTSKGFPDGLHTVGFEDPLYDTIAMVQREGSVLSPATREIARLARRMLLERS